jgi:hypothetical protein
MNFEGLNSESLLQRIKELFNDPNCLPLSGLLRGKVSGAVAECRIPELELEGLPWLAHIPNGVHGLFDCQNGTDTFIHAKSKGLSPAEGALSLFYAFESYFINPETNKDLLWDIIWWKIWILQEIQKTLPPIIIYRNAIDIQDSVPWDQFQVMLQHLRVAERVVEVITNHFSMFMAGAPVGKLQRRDRSLEQYQWRRSAISDCVKYLAGVHGKPIDETNLDMETRFNIGFANFLLQPNSCIDLSIADLDSLCLRSGVSQIKTGYLLNALNNTVTLDSNEFFMELWSALVWQLNELLPPES